MRSLAGMTICENPILTVPEVYRRTWRERFCTWPWRPWQAEEIRQVPDPNFYVLHDPHQVPQIHCHPHTAMRLRRHLESVIADPGA